MVYPRKNKVVSWVMRTYVRWLVSKEFHELIFNAVEFDKNKSVLLLANHFSFWDGLIMHLCERKTIQEKLLCYGKRGYRIQVELPAVWRRFLHQ